MPALNLGAGVDVGLQLALILIELSLTLRQIGLLTRIAASSVDLGRHRLRVESLALMHRAQSDFLILDIAPQPIEIRGVAADRGGFVLAHGVIEFGLGVDAGSAIAFDARLHRTSILINLRPQPLELLGLRLAIGLLDRQLTLQVCCSAFDFLALRKLEIRLPIAVGLRETRPLQLDIGQRATGLIEAGHVVRTTRDHLCDVRLVIGDIGIARRSPRAREVRLGSLQIVVRHQPFRAGRAGLIDGRLRGCDALIRCRAAAVVDVRIFSHEIQIR